MAIIVAGWVLVIGATVVTLYLLTPPAPAPVPVVPQTVGPDAPSSADSTAADSPAPPSAPRTERVYTAPGVEQQSPPGVSPGVSPSGGPPNAGAPPRLARGPGLGLGAPPMPSLRPSPSMNRGGPGAMMLPPAPGRSDGSRPVVPNGPMAPVNAEAQRAFEAGGAALRAGDKAAAAAEFARAVRLAPDNVPSRLNLASAYLDLNQPAKAVPHLRAVVQREPNNAAVQFTLARALLADKKLAEALPSLRKTVQLLPRERQPRVILAQVLFDTRNPQEAYKQWSALATQNPKDIEAQMQAAILANDALKQPAQAEKWLRRAVAAAPKEPQPALMLGQVLLARKDARGAAAVLTQAAQSNPDSFAVYPLLADARTAAGDSKGAASALQSALGKLPSGKTAAQKAEIKTTEGALRLALGRTLGASKQTREARAQFEQAAALLPRDPQPRALGAVAALQMKDEAGAIAGFKSALALDPKRLGDRKTLAQLLANGQQWKASDAQFALYAQARPKDAGALLDWASVAGQLKDPKHSAQVLGKAVKAAPGNAAAWTQLAIAQRASGDKTGALASYKKLNVLRPKNADALYETGRLQSEMGDNAAAYGNFKSAINARPGAVEAYPALLQAADKAGQSAAARQFLVRELAQQENLPAMKQVLEYYRGQDKQAEARDFLTDLVARAPKQDSARTALKAMTGASAEPASAKAPTATPRVNLAIAPTPSAPPKPLDAPPKPLDDAPKPSSVSPKPSSGTPRIELRRKSATQLVPLPTVTTRIAPLQSLKHPDRETNAPLIITKPSP